MYLQIRSHSEVMGVGLQHEFDGRRDTTHDMEWCAVISLSDLNVHLGRDNYMKKRSHQPFHAPQLTQVHTGRRSRSLTDLQVENGIIIINTVIWKGKRGSRAVLQIWSNSKILLANYFKVTYPRSGTFFLSEPGFTCRKTALFTVLWPWAPPSEVLPGLMILYGPWESSTRKDALLGGLVALFDPFLSTDL